LLSGLSVGSTAAAADQVASGTWSASHGGGSASGTASFVKEGILNGKLTVEGTLQVNDSDCYFARLTVVHDAAPMFYNVAEQCGQGTEPIDVTIATVTANWSASVTICRTGAGGTCGQPGPIRW
jgi:hypothetical protein